MSREIEVFGALNVSQKYLQKFFKKAGTVSKVTFKRDRVIIKFSRQDAALRATELDGKILEDFQIKVRLSQPPIKTPLTKRTEETSNSVSEYQQFSPYHIQTVQQLIWSSDISDHRKIILTTLFKIKVSEIVYYQKCRLNSEFNMFVSFLEYQFLKSETCANIKKTSEGGYVYFLNYKGKMITKDSQKVAAEKGKIHKQFQLKFKQISKRLFQMYTIIFQRQALIKTIEQKLDLEQQFEIQPFQGFVNKSYRDNVKSNVMILEVGQNKWKCYRFDGILYFNTETKLVSKSFLKFFKIHQNQFMSTDEFTLIDYCFVIEINDNSDLETEKLEAKIRNIRLYREVTYNSSNRQTSIILLFDEQLPDQKTLTNLMLNYREIASYPIYLIVLNSNAQMQKSVYLHFLKCSLEKSKEYLNTKKAEELANEMIDSGLDQLFGKTSSFQIGKDILSVQRELPKKKNK